MTKQLHKLIEIVKATTLTDSVHIERELMLIKVRATGSNHREEEALLLLADIFRASIADITSNVYTIQNLSVSTAKLDGFIELMGRERILEVVRSGVIGIARGEKSSASKFTNLLIVVIFTQGNKL